ncbi:MAG: TIGR04084 family radical SAM/SPASM domain-containing protein [Nanoarchaeota archaeon]|nr:TIGR04084 family radical SAM/SPASM domain-containing protein [Nanoarchaeota archaeon]
MFYHLIMHTNCNLSCKYCDKEEFIPYTDDYELCMPEKVQYSVEDLQNFVTKEDYLTFYGGEPLLAVDEIKQIMDNVECKGFMIQTNGLLLPKLEDYVSKMHTVIVSIDGNEEVTDKNRGKGVHKKVMENVDWLKERFNGELIARMTISNGTNVNEQVRWLLDHGFKSVHWQLDALFYEQENSDWLGEYNGQISELMDYWVSEMEKGKVVKLYPFLVVMDSLLKNEKSLLRCGSGHSNFTITTQGKVAPCPIMSEMKKYYCGDIYSKEIKKINVKEPCISCEILDKCGGRCLYSNLTQLWGEKGFNKVCSTIKYLIKELENNKPKVEELIKNKIISLEDFKHLKYNGVEVIP